MIVPASAGGLSDFIARVTADATSLQAHKSAVHRREPRAAGGNLGTNAVAKANPDGYTLGLVASGNVVINPYLYKSMLFNAKTDLVPVAPIVDAPQVLAINSEVPAKTLKELIALAKAKPGSIAYGSAGIGTTMHLAGDKFAKLAGIKLLHVPYRGAAKAVTDTAADVVQMVSIGPGQIKGLVDAGKLRVLAALSPERLAVFPNVPTAAEAGLPGLEMSTWFAIVAPKGTPDAIVQKLNGWVGDMLKDPVTAKRLTGHFLTLKSMTQPQFAAFVKEQFIVWEKTVQNAGLKPH